MNNPGLDSIISTYGYALLCYAFYNMVLLVIFFKAAPKRFMATGLSLLTAGLTFFFFGILILGGVEPAMGSFRSLANPMR